MAKRIKRVMAGLPKGVASGSQLIRDQIAKGIEKPAAIIAAIKTETGVNVSSALVNNVKMSMKKKAGKAAKATQSTKVKAGAPAPTSKPGRVGKSLTAVEVAILLTEKFGADKARQIVEVLGHESDG